MVEKIAADAGVGRDRFLGDGTFKVIAAYPPPPSPSVEPDWPDPVKTAMQDAESGMQNGQSAMSIMSACGAALEQALKALGAKGSNAYKRIENLKEQGVVTGTLADWAHNVRVVRNNAVHDYEATMDQALESFEFLKLFFRLVFTMPAEIERQRAEQAED